MKDKTPLIKVGKSQIYKPNAETPIVQKLMEIDKKLALVSIGEIEEQYDNQTPEHGTAESENMAVKA